MNSTKPVRVPMYWHATIKTKYLRPHYGRQAAQRNLKNYMQSHAANEYYQRRLYQQKFSREAA